MALKAFFDASQTPVFDALGLTAQFVAFEAISSGEVSTFTLNDMLRAGSLDNDFPKIFWQELKDDTVIRSTALGGNNTVEIVPEIRPEFKISKNSWNLGNVIFKADRCTPGTNPCNNFEFSTESVTTNPQQVESTVGNVNAQWMFIPGSKEAATTFTTSDSQTVTEETQKGAVIESGVEYGQGGSTSISTEAKAGVTIKGVFEAGGSISNTLEDNWSQT